MLRFLTFSFRRLISPRMSSREPLCTPLSRATNRPSAVSTAMPTSMPLCTMRMFCSSSYQALRPGSAFAPAARARSRRKVTSSPARQAWMSASSIRVVGTTRFCDSLIVRAIVRRVPRSGSHSPLAAAAGCGLEGAGEAGFCSRSGSVGNSGSGLLADGCSRRGCAVPSSAALRTSDAVTTPSAPLGLTCERSTLSLRARARTAGVTLTPPTVEVRSLSTSPPACILPTTVPESSRSSLLPASPLSSPADASGAESAGWSSSAAASVAGGSSWVDASLPASPATSNSASGAPVLITSPGPP